VVESIPCAGVIVCTTAGRPPDRRGDLTGTAGVEAGRPHENSLRLVGMNYQLLRAPHVAALEPAALRCASSWEACREEDALAEQAAPPFCAPIWGAA
jgi:hypothetical protein